MVVTQESRTSVVSMDKVQSYSNGHQRLRHESTVDQETPAAAHAPRHAVRFAELAPAPLKVTAGVDVHDAGVATPPPDSANSVSVAETQQQQPAGAKTVTARILTPTGKEPRSVAV